MRKPPTILVVEDEAAIAELIRINLRHSGYEVIWAADGAAAQATLESQLPDLILLDWMLPGTSGIALAKRWRADARTKATPIILLTARNEENDRVTGLDAGADDYISKPFSTKELLARIRAVLRRSTPEPDNHALALGGLTLDASTHRVEHAGQPIKLGPTEFKLLHYFMQHAERVHSRSKLLHHVWGEHADIEERTVDVHIKRLREALGEAGSMVETVRGTGYRLSQHMNQPASKKTD